MAKDELQRLIREQGSIRRMAGAAEVSASTIRYWLKRWELKSCGESIKPGCKNCGAVVKRRPNIYCSSACQHQFKRRVRLESYPEAVGRRVLKSHLLDCRGWRCEVCGIVKWMGRPVPLELDHRDGDSTNNDFGNLRLICPNCHAQTDTYKGKNMGRGRYYRRERYAQGKSH
jgi:hypothetical protein